MVATAAQGDFGFEETSLDFHLLACRDVVRFVEELLALGAPVTVLNELVPACQCQCLICAQEVVEVVDFLQRKIKVVAVLAGEANAADTMAPRKGAFGLRCALSAQPAGNLGSFKSHCLLFVRTLFVLLP